MPQPSIEIKETRELPREDVLALYTANGWSSAQKPDELLQGLLNSHGLVTAWHGEKLVGLANAISAAISSPITRTPWCCPNIRAKASAAR